MPQTEIYKLTDAAFLDHPAAPYVVRLMMGWTAMHSGFRWSTRVADDLSLEGGMDLLLSAITTAGWAHETVRVARGAADKKLIGRDLLDGDSELQAFWDECIAPPEPGAKRDRGRTTLLHDVRNRYVGHFDTRTPSGVLAELRCDLQDTGELPDIVVGVDGRITEFPLAEHAFRHWLGCAPNDKAGIHAGLTELTDTIGLVLRFVDRLLAALIGDQAVKVHDS